MSGERFPSPTDPEEAKLGRDFAPRAASPGAGSLSATENDVQAEAILPYDQARDLAARPFRAVCYSPHNSLFFDTLGLVRACCLNRRFVLGDIAKERLPDIWRGARIKKLRAALERYDLRLGCEACDWQIADGNFTAGVNSSGVHALKYDGFPLSDDLRFPTNMEFNLGNTCNLECVMCNGEYSSSIRSRREKLEPLPRPYHDQFFEDLREFIPHLRTAQFLGGEPFLIVEHFRVWDLLIEAGSVRAVGVTTNGTIYNERVERVLESLPVGITISADGATRATFEKIRVNADFDRFLANFRKFHAYGERVARPVSFNFTLSKLNCHEFADFLRFADDHGCAVNVCTLSEPAYLSLYKMRSGELAELVSQLEARDAGLNLTLPANQTVWRDVVQHLRNRLTHADSAVSRVNAAELVQITPTAQARHWVNFSLAPRLDGRAQVQAEEAALAKASQWSGGRCDVLVTDRQDVVTQASYADRGFLGLDTDIVGQSLDELFGVCVEHFGPELIAEDQDAAADRTDRLVTFLRDGQKQVELRVIEIPRFEEYGPVAGMTVFVGRRPVAAE